MPSTKQTKIMWNDDVMNLLINSRRILLIYLLHVEVQVVDDEIDQLSLVVSVKSLLKDGIHYNG